MTYKKRTIKEQYQRLKHTPIKPNWLRMINIFIVQIISLLIGILIFPDQIMTIVMTSMMMGMFVNMPLPGKIIKTHALIFLITGTLALLTAAIASTNNILIILFFILWLLFFTIMCFKDMLKQNIGLFTIFMYFMAIFMIIGDFTKTATNIPTLLNLSIYIGLVGFTGFLIGLIPPLILIKIKHDPIKNGLIASLYTEIDYDTFIDRMGLILASDKTPTTISLIESALRLKINKITLKHLLKNKNKAIQEINKEIQKIEQKTAQTIQKNKIKTIKLDLTPLENISKNLNQTTTNTTDYVNLKKICKTYLKEFQTINQINNTEPKELPPINTPKNKPEINLKNINIRYIIRFITATLISFIFDTIIGNTLQYTGTITSFMAMNPKSNITENKVIKRLIATITGVTLAILIGITLYTLNLTILLPIFIIIGLGLFYALILENYGIAVFFSCLAFILMKSQNLFIIQGIERIISCAFACIVSYIIAKYLLPNEEQTNITQLTQKKIKYTKQLLNNTLENQKTLHLINKNHQINTEINTQLTRIQETYKNTEKDIEIIKQFTESLKQIQHDTININTYIKKHQIQIETTKLAKSINNFLNIIQEIIKTGEIVELKTPLHEVKNNIQKLEEKGINKTLIRQTEWLIEDFEITYNIITEAEQEKTFTKLNMIL